MTKTETFAALKRQAHDSYLGQPAISIAAIATVLGMSERSFYRKRKAWGWPPRREALNRKALKQTAESPADAIPPAPAPTKTARTSGPAALRKAALSLAQVTRERIDALVREQQEGPIDHDRTARTLAAYAKTLTTAQALLEQEGTKLDENERTERPARSLHELRDELARHLERIVAEEEARGRDGLLV